MPDVPDYELQTPEPPASPVRPTRSAAPWIAAAVVMVAAGAAFWFFFRSAPEPQQAASEAPASAPAAPPPTAARSLCTSAEAAVLPPLDESDATVGKLVRALSSHPRVTVWLATKGLIRNFTVVVENIASGQTPARHLQALRLSGPFRVIDSRDALLVDPRSYERYTSTAAAVGSVDAQAAARLCATLKPRLEEAYRELGRAEMFDQALERAIVLLLNTPAPAENVRLVPKGAVYAFEDEALERLAPAQKQLIRMGPRNMRVVQDTLRRIALAIGIPPERLPQ
jgi:hypothetical protein